MKTIWAVAALVVAVATTVEGIGVNWGTQASQNLLPSNIVQMLKDNKIYKVKLFDADPWVVKQFAGTGIEVMLGIPNLHLASLADRYKNAQAWVKKNLTRHINDGGVNIKYVAVGNEPFLTGYNGSFVSITYPALWNIQKAINEAGLGDQIKATIPQNADVYGSGSGGPSAGDFRSDIRTTMKQIVQFLRDNNAPFLVNIYPFLSLSLSANFPIAFAFFDGGAPSVNDNGISYTNMFDANLDTLVSALKRAGCGKVPIIVGEIGWPTDGDKHATVELAQKFYAGFFKKMATGKGTPLYPYPIEYYLFSLTDENGKSIAPGDFERHWGVFRYDGQPKFPIDITGKGNAKMPVGAKNVRYMEKKWCVYAGGGDDKVSGGMNYACSRGDCTALSYEGPCAKLDDTSKVSYAFNMYFQMNNQDVETCDFGGIAKIVDKNASTGNCLFPIALENGGFRAGAHMGSVVFVGLMGFFFFLL